VLILNDPLRGVDANTKEDLYELLRDLAEQGMAIVLLSTELIELLTVCDRIAVFHRGSIGQMLDAHRATDTDIVAAMFAHVDETHEEAGSR
jgi:ribose transport system ATP-binding protein